MGLINNISISSTNSRTSKKTIFLSTKINSTFYVVPINKIFNGFLYSIDATTSILLYINGDTTNTIDINNIIEKRIPLSLQSGDTVKTNTENGILIGTEGDI